MYRQWKNKSSSLNDLNEYKFVIFGLGDFRLPTADANNYAMHTKIIPYLDKSTIEFLSTITIKDNKIILEYNHNIIDIDISLFYKGLHEPYKYFNDYSNCRDCRLDDFKFIKVYKEGITVSYKNYDKSIKVFNIPESLCIHLNNKGCIFKYQDELVGTVFNNGIYEYKVSVDIYERRELYEILQKEYNINFNE